MNIKSITTNLMVSDVKATVAWYQHYLEAELASHVPGKKEGEYQWAMIKSGELELMFQEEEVLKEEFPIMKNLSPGGGFTLYIRLSGVRELYKKIHTEVEVLSNLNTTFYGMTEFTIKDINGYILTFGEALVEAPQNLEHLA